MSVVFKGYDNNLKRHVAIKVLHRHLASHKEANARFKREAFAVAKLKHENILDIYDYSDDNNEESFIVTEFIDGPTLRVFLESQDDLLPEIGALLCNQICRALVHAHQAGIVHRDIKPENIMIRSDGVMKLMDFGIAQMLDVTRMTATGQLLGSPAYMSPEHVKGRPLDHRTDIFAVGTVLYQLVTGVLPFQGNNTHEVLKKIADCEYTEPCQVNPKVAKDLSKIIHKSLSVDPENRQQSVVTLHEELTAFLNESGIDNHESLCTSYLKTPNDTSDKVTSSLVPYLTSKGISERTEAPSKALESFNRVLAIEPDNLDVKKELTLLANASKRKKMAKLFLTTCACGLAVMLVGFFIFKPTLNRNRTSHVSSKAQDTRKKNQPTYEAPNTDLNKTPDLPVLARSKSKEDSIAIDSDPSPKPLPKKVKPVASLPKSPKKSNESETPQTTLNTRLVVIPHRGAEYRVGKSAWEPLRGPSHMVTTELGEVISARNVTCCQEKQILVTKKNSDSIRLRLGFLPGSLTPRCNSPEVKVSINGKSSRINKPATIVINRATGTESINVHFIQGDSIDKQRISIKAKESKEVSCDF